MYLTTVRVRKARRDHVDAKLSTAQIKALGDHDVVEVLAAGELVALVDAFDLTAHPLWVKDDVAISGAVLTRFVDGAMRLMDGSRPKASTS